MGRKRIDIKLIENRKNRNSTFKKRRIGLLRKAMELSLLTGAIIQLKIYKPSELSLVEYFSSNEEDFNTIVKSDISVVKRYHKYFNKDIDHVGNIDEDDFNIRLKQKWEQASKEQDDEEDDDAADQPKEEGAEEYFKRKLKEKVDNLSLDQLILIAQ